MYFRQYYPTGGGYKSGIPNFSFTGQYQLIDDGNGDWRLKLLTSGVLMFTGSGDLLVDVFLVGGGGGGAYTSVYYCYGAGGGGYTLTELAQVLTGGTEYTVTVGAASGATSFGPYSAQGGANGYSRYTSGVGGQCSGGNGGSGGAAVFGDSTTYHGGRDGTDGQHRPSQYSAAGKGQGSTTREFAEPNGEMYANGGSCTSMVNAISAYTKTNMGHGGHGVPDAALRAGQPGIVIIRNHRRAA